MRQWLRECVVRLAVLTGRADHERAQAKQSGPLVQVVCFHDVPDTERFQCVLQAIADSANILTPDEFHRGAFQSDRLNVLLTFDDGYQSWLEVVLPTLEERNLKALFFLSSGGLDAASDAAAETRFVVENLLLTTPRQLLDWSGAAALLAAGHTLGGHTATHQNLAACSEAELTQEITADKQRLEQRLGVSLKDFAYPFGTRAHITKAARATARAAGYTHCYSAEPRYYQHDTEADIPRLILDDVRTAAQTKRWLAGGYAAYAKLR